MNKALLAGLVVTMAAVNMAPAAWADDDDNSGDSAKRGVARVSIINGNVSVRRGDSGEAVAAALNAPLVATDRLLTGEGARAELQFDAINMVRLAASTEVRLGELEYHKYQVQIATGTVMFRVMRQSEADVEISTPSVSVRPLKPGAYRITVRPDGTSEITVRMGEAEIFSPGGSEKLAEAKTMQSRGPASDPEFQVASEIPLDAFDRWNESRDRTLDRVAGNGKLNPDVNGVEELEGNGRWVDDPAYGSVWVPTVDAGWAPYRVGRWVWVDYYGWTWVSGDPWGWAPYHYGRWYWGSLGWSWYPGPILGPCYWRPALVGFFGWGGGLGIGGGFGFGNVGWVPLAPFERFHAWYGPGFYGRSGSNVNIVHNTNVTNIYRNARVTNGVTSVAAGNFGHGAINNGNYVHAGSTDLARAGAVRGAMPVAPGRESTRFSDRQANTAGMPHASNASFYSNRPASQVSHLPFAQQQRSFSQGQKAASPTTGVSPARTSGTPAAASGGWQRFNPNVGGSAGTGAQSSTNHSGTQSTGSSNAGSGNGGWQRLNGAGVTGGRESGQQPVRINPSIVQNRANSSGSSGGSTSRPQSNPASFGGAHTSSGGGGGGSRPSGGGGGSHSGGGGGGSHGGGGGGGHK